MSLGKIRRIKTKEKTGGEKDMKFKKRKILSIALILMLAGSALIGCGGGGGGGGGGGAENGDTAEVITLRLASHTPLEHFIHYLNLETVDLIHERTEGRVEVLYFPVNQLGDYSTVYEELMMGTIDLMQGPLPDTVSRVLGAAYMPYYAPGYDYLLPLYGRDSFLHRTVEEAALGTGVYFLGFTVEGFIGMGCVINPTDIFTPGTPKGVNMRAPGALLAMLFPIQDLGFNAVTVPYAEVPTAIQTGVVDGWSGGTPIVNLAWLSDVINYFHVNYMHVEAPSYAGSVRGLAKLSDVDRRIVLDVMMEQSERSFFMAQEYEQIALQDLRDAGIEVFIHTPDQIRVLADFVRDVTWTRLEAEFGEDIVSTLREEHARYVSW